jgi:hypothetical protein
MDLKQRKLNKSEWESIERSVSQTELYILNLIIKGIHDVNIRINHNNSIFTFLKVEYSEKMEDYIYHTYLRKRVEPMEAKLMKLDKTYKPIKMNAIIKINSIDRVRLERFNEDSLKKTEVYEFILLEQTENLFKAKENNNYKLFHYCYFNLYKLIQNNVSRLNRHFIYFIQNILTIFSKDINKLFIIDNSFEFIEQNTNLIKYSDLVLYEHQKRIFTSIKSSTPKLILYVAPTGTGKTLTPIALSEVKKVIFVCAARHVGIALARASISVNKKIAFAFGCSSAGDIRLHYFAAKEFTRSKKTGGIKKVDNSVGDNVEIIICDIKSYLPAMYYMLAFFPANDIVTYWDEPTITMDYESHEFHKTIHKNWKENVIPNVVLSSATLPKEHELTQTIPDFLNKFPGAEICNIVSHDCKKSIPIINSEGYTVLPHYLSEDYDEICKIANHCFHYLTILRYFDLAEVVNFISFIHKNNYATNKMQIERHFEELDKINMTNIKIYYVELLRNIQPVYWKTIYSYFQVNRIPKILENTNVDTKGNKIKKSYSITSEPSASSRIEGAPIFRLASEQITHVKKEIGTSGIYISTKDAYSLTDGPAIFMAKNIEKIAKFYVQQANIPTVVLDDLMQKIEYNNGINKQMYELEVELDVLKEQIEDKVKNKVSGHHDEHTVNGRNKSNKDPKKLTKDIPEELQHKSSVSKLTQKINSLRAQIKRASLNDTFIPNTKSHLEKWGPATNIFNAFCSSIDENTVCDIMALNNVDNLWKVLLMMGIGGFDNHANITYTEIMKNLADQQKLFMIIADSDYIYGLNYQFCHGFISKDLHLTQEKILQAMGRIGRNNIQQTYTIRFRDDSQILKLFTEETEKPEVINMNILFHSSKLIWENNEYIQVEEDEGNVEKEDMVLEDTDEDDEEVDEDDDVEEDMEDDA